MVRLLLPLLLVVAGALVVALVRDRRAREVLWLSRLRGSFLHGAPLGGVASIASLNEIQAPGGRLRLRLPAAWTGGFDEPTKASFDCGSGRRLRVDLLTVARRGAAGPLSRRRTSTSARRRSALVTLRGRKLPRPRRSPPPRYSLKK